MLKVSFARSTLYSDQKDELGHCPSYSGLRRMYGRLVTAMAGVRRNGESDRAHPLVAEWRFLAAASMQRSRIEGHDNSLR